MSLPSNYNQKDVKNIIPPFYDANGDKTADPPIFHKGYNVTIGQNYAGYYRFRNSVDNKTLIDSEAMHLQYLHQKNLKSCFCRQNEQKWRWWT